LSRDSDPERIKIEGEGKRIGIPRKPQKTGSSWSITVPMKELVRQAIIFGMDVADFALNFEAVLYEVTPPGGSWLRDGWTVLRWERRKPKKKEEYSVP
jgi:hypothetical protein